MIVTTMNELPGYRIVVVQGLVRGVIVRSRSVLGNIGAGIQSLFGGDITIYTQLAEDARQHAYDRMVEHAIAMRYDANEIMEGITEVLAYGTAVRVEPITQ